MGWADNYIKQLQAGNNVQFRPRGGSMHPKVKDGSLVTVEPLKDNYATVGDVVLCQLSGSQYLHYVSAIQQNTSTRKYQISNAKGKINGWASKVYGVVIKIE